MEEEDPTNDDGAIKRVGVRVYFHCEVTRTNVLTLCERLCEAEGEALQHHHESILLFIHSEGGDAHAGLSAMNHIETMRVPVITVADGFVASAATFLLLGGRRRLAMRHSMVLIHQLSTAFWGKYADLIDEMQNTHQLMETLRDLYRERTGIKKKRLSNLLNKELTMTAQECIQFGVVDELFGRHATLRPSEDPPRV